MNETLCMVALSCLKGLSRTRLLHLLNSYGSATAVCELTRNELPTEWSDALRRAELEVEFCQMKGIRILTPAETDYPTRLRECDDAPPVLFFRGTADLNARHVISVVGTRRITEYGKKICQDFITELHCLLPDALVVSGLAYGVDIHSHRACVENNLPTVAVLAHGLDRIYPTPHRNTAADMTRRGGLLTEYLTGTNPDKGNFVRRNRIVAGLSDATVVVESATKGGALITARLAQDYNRDVFAFPGRIGDEYSAGCNHLIRRNGAALISSAQDLLEAMGWDAMAQQPVAVQRELFPELTEEERLICDLLRGVDEKAINVLVAETRKPISKISATLFELEMKGLVKAVGGNRYRFLG